VRRKGAALDVFREGAGGIADHRREVRVAPHELGAQVPRQAHDVVKDEDLPVAVGARADSERRHGDLPRDLGRQLSQLQAAAPLAGLVLDLRGNPGGVLESAVNVADDFLEAGVIVRAEGRTADSRFEMHASGGDLLRHAPLVVLVDRGSASGAEIVAGALRDHGRATLMGERTFGKGSVQTVMPLRNGQALKLTTSRYYTPSGASIHDRGIEPDVSLSVALDPASVASRDAAADPAVQAALQYLRDRSLGTQVALAGNP